MTRPRASPSFPGDAPPALGQVLRPDSPFSAALTDGHGVDSLGIAGPGSHPTHTFRHRAFDSTFSHYSSGNRRRPRTHRDEEEQDYAPERVLRFLPLRPLPLQILVDRLALTPNDPLDDPSDGPVLLIPTLVQGEGNRLGVLPLVLNRPRYPPLRLPGGLDEEGRGISIIWLTRIGWRAGLPVPIRCRYVNRTQVSMYLACFPSTAHETAPPSLDGVPRFGSPASTVL